MKNFISLIFILIIFTSLQAEVIRVEIPEMAVDTLVAYARFSEQEIDESSALIKSRNFADLYWTLNDSGDEARIFPFNSSGEAYYPEWDQSRSEIRIPDAVNIDWESLAIDNSGNIIIGAFGNNANQRRDLALYVIKEPVPTLANKTRVLRTIPFYYPDQESFPPQKRNFDCEALFVAHDNYYLLTKHRSDRNTKLYRFDSVKPHQENELTLLAEFEIDGAVTGADASADGKMLAVLTYNNVWVFVAENADDFFNGEIYYKAISAQQCEGICFDGDDLLISNEQMELFRL
ncbi:MAG: hypothetical protein R6U84_01850, partial [Candidatus Cloacimonadales bacterium]